MKQGKTAIIVTGDANRNKVLTVPGGGMATVKIELPNNWDSLMADLGYKPLKDYYVKISPQPQTKVEVKNNPTVSQTPKNTQTAEKRPSPEKYREMSQQNSQPQKTQTNTTSMNKRPSPEKYREMHKQGNWQGQNKRPSPEKYREMLKNRKNGNT